MALSIKVDTQEIPSILKMFGLGGINDVADTSDTTPPVDSSIGGEANPSTQPASSDTQPSEIPSTHDASAPPTKLLRLQQALGTDQPVPVPPLQVPNQTPAALPPGIGAPTSNTTIKPTFREAHPNIFKTLAAITEFAQNAGPGVGAPTFGQGFATAAAQPGIRAKAEQDLQQSAIENALGKAQVADIPIKRRMTLAEAAKTEAEAKKLGEPDKPHVDYNQGIPVTITRGNEQFVIGGQDMPPELKPIADAAIAAHKQRVSEQQDKPDTKMQDTQRARDLEKQLRAGTINDTDREELTGRQLEAKLQGVPAEVVAQAGKPPVPAQFPKGENDSAYKNANTVWGKQVEAIKNREAAAAGAARGEGFGAGRRMAVIDPRDGQVKIMSAWQAENLGAAPAGEGIKLMSKDAQFSELHVAAQKAKDAINGLDKDFTPTQIAKLTLAFSHDDAGVVKNEVDSLLGTQQLTPAQQDFVIWINQLNERAMSLRNIAGMGQGSQDLRSAIKATLPGLKSGSKGMALKQLDAFNNQVNLLEKGVPKINKPQSGTTKSAPATNTKYPDFVPD